MNITTVITYYNVDNVRSVPIVSHVYIMDCVRGGQLLDRAAYMLPAGFSALLQKEVK